MFDTSKLRGRIIEKFGSQGRFASEIKRSQAYVSEVLKGKAYLGQRDIELWANLLDISGSELNDYFFTRKVHEMEQIGE